MFFFFVEDKGINLVMFFIPLDTDGDDLAIFIEEFMEVGFGLAGRGLYKERKTAGSRLLTYSLRGSAGMSPRGRYYSLISIYQLSIPEIQPHSNQKSHITKRK